MKSRILFVDDEIKILQGLRRMLREMRGKWEMVFAESGAKALEAMEKASFDVVVSDMRMPGMDGAQLLTEVRKRHPQVIRIILSGFAKEESVLRTVGPAHQYLAKPCDHRDLIDTVERTLALRKFLDSEDLRSLVAGLQTLPTPSAVYLELLDEFNSPHASAVSLAEKISLDVAMAAQTLKLTNSAYFGLPTKVTSPLEAVQLLGFDTIRALVLVAGFFSQFRGDAETALTMERLSRRCLGVGALAKAIAEAENLDTLVTDQACCAGVLSHVGTLVLIARWPARFKKVVSLVEDDGLAITEAERRVFGANHAELGAYLLGLWGFVDPIVEAVAYHHEPRRCCCRRVNALLALHAAQYLTRGDWDGQDSGELVVSSLDQEYLREAGVIERLPAWAEIYRSLEQKGTVND